MKAPTFLFFYFFSGLLGFSQFNNMYLNDIPYYGICFGVKENVLSSEYYLPVGYSNAEGTNHNFGYLKINQNGLLNELKQSFEQPSSGMTTVRQAFLQTADNKFILLVTDYTSGISVYKLDNNLDTIWTITDGAFNGIVNWGGTELFNGDFITANIQGSSSTDTLKMQRYSPDGVLLQNFDINLNFDFLYPTTFIAQDSLVYISFHDLVIGEHRRNHIVCYNAFTGDELWETNQLEDENELGYSTGYMCVTINGTLKHVFFKQVELAFPGDPTSSSYVYLTVVDVDYETGALTNEAIISNLEYASYVVDVAATNDGGFVVLSKSYDQCLDEAYFWTIVKISEAMELEWRHQYFQPIEFIGGNGSRLYDIETTSDDCIIAAGTAWGVSIANEYLQLPWVLKIDACGNEIVTDCSLSGLSELSGRNKISIYPNPARDRVFLKAENAIQRAMIFDMNGKMVHDEIFSGAQEQTLFIDHLPQGLYLVTAIDNKGVRSSSKVVVEK
ncbi:MAG: T9SS type A sorting domain-containing protein [Flavobacteriales bacterium]